jgi:hypothetical protein
VVGALICLNELDPEIIDILDEYRREISYLKVEAESLRHLYRHLGGLTKENVEAEFASVRKEVKQVSRSLIEFCDNL